MQCGAIVLCILPRLAGTAGHGGVTYSVTSVPDRRVAVFVDYQNTYHRARELFGSPGDPPTVAHVHPDLLGDLLLTLGDSGGSRRGLAGIGLYRGRPGFSAVRSSACPSIVRRPAGRDSLESASIRGRCDTKPRRGQVAELCRGEARRRAWTC